MRVMDGMPKKKDHLKRPRRKLEGVEWIHLFQKWSNKGACYYCSEFSGPIKSGDFNYLLSKY
jgi:hypothetical protein